LQAGSLRLETIPTLGKIFGFHIEFDDAHCVFDRDFAFTGTVQEASRFVELFDSHLTVVYLLFQA
jgi:hypothetical protein